MDLEAVRCQCTAILHYKTGAQTVVCPSCGREMLVSELAPERQKLQEELQRGKQAQQDLMQANTALKGSQERLHQAVSALEGLRHSQENEESILRDLSRQMGVDQEEMRGILQDMRKEQLAGQNLLQYLMGVMLRNQQFAPEKAADAHSADVPLQQMRNWLQMGRYQLVTDKYEELITKGVCMDNAWIYLYALCAAYRKSNVDQLTESDVDLSAEPLFGYAVQFSGEEEKLNELLKRNQAWRERKYQYKIQDDDTAEITEYTGEEENVVIPTMLGGKCVTSIGKGAFSCCVNMTEMKLPDSITNIGENAFSYCDNLASITLPDSLMHIGDGAFEHCKSLTSVIIPDKVTSIGTAAFVRCYRLKRITLPDSLISIGDYAFRICDRLERITLPDSVTKIGEEAFDGFIRIHVQNNAYAREYARQNGLDLE